MKFSLFMLCLFVSGCGLVGVPSQKNTRLYHEDESLQSPLIITANEYAFTTSEDQIQDDQMVFPGEESMPEDENMDIASLKSEHDSSVNRKIDVRDDAPQLEEALEPAVENGLEKSAETIDPEEESVKNNDDGELTLDEEKKDEDVSTQPVAYIDSSLGCTGKTNEVWDYASLQPAFGAKRYIEYRPGNMPVIISSPHGGSLAPSGIPAQENILGKDGGSLEYSVAVVNEIERLTGKRPHLIINHLTRHRLNANLSQDRASAGNQEASLAWKEFHQFTNDAKKWVTDMCGSGHYFDFHTNGHSDEWNEIAFAVNRSELNLSDLELNSPEIIERSTIRSLSTRHPFVDIIRGPKSIGVLLENQNIKAVPGTTYPGPGSGGYFNGGYNIRIHGSMTGGVIDATQIESHFSYVNYGERKRMDFSKKLAQAIVEFMRHFYAQTRKPEEL